MAKSDVSDLVDAYEFGSTYPVVSVPSPGPTTGATPGGSAAPSQLQQIVNQALQGVLGRSFKEGDHRSFRAALEISFEYKEEAGMPSYQWKPRAYPSVGATDVGGGISGAQFSLVSFANSLHQTAATLIDNLQSLVPDVDEENFGAAKSIFVTAWNEFIGELSREGGPRAPRANSLDESIFSVAEDGTATGHLVRLGNLLGVLPGDDDTTTLGKDRRLEFQRTNVVTSEEEGYLTNFIALTDYYLAVSNSWRTYFTTFFKEQRDLGGRLLLIERQLAVIEDGVNEIFVAMDSVNIDQAERLVTIINFTGDDNMSVEDYLTWVASFASREAPQLLRDGGKLGVLAIVPTAQKLRNLTGQLINKCVAIRNMRGEVSESGLPNQFGHARVINPLRELERYLKTLVDTADLEF